MTDTEHNDAAAEFASAGRCMPGGLQLFPRRPRRYNPDNPPPPRPPRPSPAKNTVVLKPTTFNTQQQGESKAPPTVPVFGVQMGGAGETTLEDMAAMLIERAKVKKAAQALRPAWDSSWRIGMTEAEEEAVGCLSDVAGVGVCGVQPIGRQANSKLEESTSAFSVTSCGASIRDVVANAEPLPSGKGPEESGGILRRLLNIGTELPDTKGLIRRFEPSGARLFVSDRDRAMSKAWLNSHRLLAGRAVRCLHQVPGEEYPPMRALAYEVNDALYEPILGYYSPAYGISPSAATARRQEVKRVLDFIHEGVVAGTNRSVVVAVAYLMIYHGLGCQPAFTEQLLRLERELLSRTRQVPVSHWRDLPGQWTDTRRGLSPEDGGEEEEEEGEEGEKLLPASSFMLDKLHAQVLSMERTGAGHYVLCVAPPPHQDSERAGLDVCVPLRGAVVEAVGDKEMLVRSGGRVVRAMMETEEERERFVEAAVAMAEKAWRAGEGKGEQDIVLAELDETGEDGAVATRVHVVPGDSDEEEEVWI